VKKIFLAMIVCVALILNAGLVMAASNVVLDKIDVGNETAEQWAGMSSWGPLATPPPPALNSRVIWDISDNDTAATITFNRSISRGAATALNISHLDGIADDSFDVYVKDAHDDWVFVGNYTDFYSVDTWVTSEFPLPNGKSLQLGRGGTVEVKLVATGPMWAQFKDNGQVQIDWIELIGNGGK
jgi:hypothetical protein